MAVLALVAILLGVAPMTLVADGGKAEPTGSSGRPALTIARVEPLTVTGRAFIPGERVRITADTRRKNITAGGRGGFKVLFPQTNACNGVVVVARGSEGSRASVAFASLANVHCLEPGAQG